MTDVPAAPRRGTRPRNRRALILQAASRLFYDRGYADVGVGDIAEAVAIAPSALYRHFSGKQQLLDEVMWDRIHQLDLALDVDDDPIGSLSAAALDHRDIGVLWQREGRHLTPEGRARARAELRGARARLRDLILERRPELDPDHADLLARAASSLLSSMSYHHLELPRAEYERLIADLLLTVIATPSPEPSVPAPARADGPRIAVQARREALLNHAIVMFAEHGYAGVTLEDVAGQAGVSGPSVYTYFPSKAALLGACFRRGHEWLHRDLAQAVAGARDHADALHLLIRSYRDFTLANSQLVDLLVTEMGSLPTDERAQARQLQHDYIDEWVHILQTIDPARGALPTRIRLQAWFTIVNDVARAPAVRERPGVREVLESLGVAMLSGDAPVNGRTRNAARPRTAG